MKIPFRKMHGLGNDFVVFDARTRPLDLTDAQVRAISDRHRGIGCDQLVILRPSEQADVFMEIRNADGGRIAACGNATRCVGWLVMQEHKAEVTAIHTDAGILHARMSGGVVSVDMGKPRTEWQEIPLAEACDTNHLPIELEVLRDPVAVSMGNPHMVFFVPEVSQLPLERLGPLLEYHPLYPQRCNVSIARIESRDRITLRVWERGTGLTDACGTAACATAVAAYRRSLAGRDVTVMQPGGPLRIVWDDEGHVHMAGAVAESFTGEIAL